MTTPVPPLHFKPPGAYAANGKVPPHLVHDTAGDGPDMAGGLGESPPLAFRLWHELGTVQASDRLVRRLLGEGSFGVLYGVPGCGKSFLALDLCLHIALGRPWFGLPVTQRATLYLAAEGQMGVSNRVAAFRQRHSLDIDSNVPFALLPVPVDLRDPTGGTAWFLEQIELVTAAMGAGKIGLIVVDTLARTFGSGSENDPADMGSFIANLDKIREKTGAAILVVHHMGKEETRGARGHSSLRGAADTMIEASGLSGTRSFRVEKQKDGESGTAYSYELEGEDLGADDDGEPITSCVVMPSSEPAAASKRPVRLSAAAAIAIGALRQAIDAAGFDSPPSNHIPPGARVVTAETWKKYAVAQQISAGNDNAQRMAFKRASDALQHAGIIKVWQDHVWILKGAE